MDRHALAARNITDNILTANGIAALGSVNQEVIHAFDLNLDVFAQTEDTLYDRTDLGLLCRRGFQAIPASTFSSTALTEILPYPIPEYRSSNLLHPYSGATSISRPFSA